MASRTAADEIFVDPLVIDGLEYPDYPGMAIWYCEEVVAGRIPSPKFETLACRRFLDMLKVAKGLGGEFFWSPDHVVDICAFIEKLPHTKAFDGTITLEPVQCWWLAAIFGFREKGTGLRWVRSADLWMPRKNTKTTLSTGIVLYCANFEGEPGAEVVISAGSEKQAHIPYDGVVKTLELDPELAQITGAKTTQRYAEFHKTGGQIKLATSRAENLDGYNPSMVLAEEKHAQSQEVIGVLKTAMGSRRSPLFLSISTAGRDMNAAAFDDWKFGEQLLQGEIEASRNFVVIYAATEKEADKRFDWKLIEKVNPLFGVSLSKAAVEEEIHEAKKSESKLQEYKRTRLNIWTRAAGNLISRSKWDACADRKLDIDVFTGYPLFVGIDLASRHDLNAAVFGVKVGKTLYWASRFWLPENAQRLEDDRFADMFRAWHREGYLTLTPGSYIDYKILLAEVLGLLQGHNVQGIGLDDYQANLMAKEIEDGGHKVFMVPKTARALTLATNDIIARVEDPALLQHDGNPCMSWCAGNVVGYYDSNDNVLPKKEKKGSKANIDGFDAGVIMNALRMDYEAGVLGLSEKEKEKVNPYLQRGLPGQAA